MVTTALLLLWFTIAPALPSLEFPENMQLVTTALTEPVLSIAPAVLPELPEKEQLVKVTTALTLFVTAPLAVVIAVDVLPEKTQAVTVTPVVAVLYIPPELVPLKLSKIQFVTVAEVVLLYIPPPCVRAMFFVSTETEPLPSALPLVTVKPSNLVVLASLTDKTTWWQLSELSFTVPMSPLKIVTFEVQFRWLSRFSVPAKPP